MSETLYAGGGDEGASVIYCSTRNENRMTINNRRIAQGGGARILSIPTNVVSLPLLDFGDRRWHLAGIWGFQGTRHGQNLLMSSPKREENMVGHGSCALNNLRAFTIDH